MEEPNTQLPTTNNKKRKKKTDPQDTGLSNQTQTSDSVTSEVKKERVSEKKRKKSKKGRKKENSSLKTNTNNQDEQTSENDELSNPENKQRKRKHEEIENEEQNKDDVTETETVSPSLPSKKKPKKKYWTKEQKAEHWRRRHAQMIKEQEQIKYWNEHPLEHPAIKYLEQWKNDRASWKFKKSRQVYLQQNVFNPTRVPDSHFPLLLEYLKAGQGKFFENLVQNAKEYVERKNKTIEMKKKINLNSEIVADNEKKQKVPENSKQTEMIASEPKVETNVNLKGKKLIKYNRCKTIITFASSVK